MKRALGLLAATALLTSGAVAFSTASVGAAATTTPVVALVQKIKLPAFPEQKNQALVYAVHGLNLDGQDAQSDRGTAVTLCSGDTALASDFQFGDIADPLDIQRGTPLTLKVFLGADADCTGADAVISQDVTVPDVLAVALVATAGPDGVLRLLPVVLNVTPDEDCGPPPIEPGSTPQGNGTIPPTGPPTATIGAVHAANAGPVVVIVNGKTLPTPGSFGESFFGAVPPDTYEVEVTLDDTPIVGPVDLPLGDCELTVVYVVGNQPIAEETTTTTAPAPAAAAVAARPAFTG